MASFRYSLMPRRLSLSLLSLGLFFLLCFGSAIAQPTARLPDAVHMQQLRPEQGRRLRVMDRLMPSTARLAGDIQNSYVDPEVLGQVEAGLRRVALSGDPLDLFTPEERTQFHANRAELARLEQQYVQALRVRTPLTIGAAAQKLITAVSSPAPKGDKLKSFIQFWKQKREGNIL